MIAAASMQQRPLNTEYKLSVEMKVNGEFISVYIDSMTGNGLKRCKEVMRAERADRIVAIDRFQRRAKMANGATYDAAIDSNRPILGTFADKAQHIDGVARSYFRDTPDPYQPFWRWSNLWAWAWGITLLIWLPVVFWR